jgi:hypothetical protein
MKPLAQEAELNKIESNNLDRRALSRDRHGPLPVRTPKVARLDLAPAQQVARLVRQGHASRPRPSHNPKLRCDLTRCGRLNAGPKIGDTMRQQVPGIAEPLPQNRPLRVGSASRGTEHKT